jgi:riboflavin kinase/FMN adenylyltransferase
MVIDRVRRVAEEQGLLSAVVTFDRHPASVVRPASAPMLLTDLGQKLELLADTGVDYVLIVHFDVERSEEPASDFVKEVLVGCLDARAVVVGHDFHFGYKRSGNVALLQDMGAELGFDVTGLRLFSGGLGEEPISSTRIRRLIAEGSVGEAASLLGRPHQVRGTVSHGDERGRLLGFPTANVAMPEVTALPADGVYAGWYLRPDGVRRAAAISLGRRPTFYLEQELSLLEAYILDFEGDLYGEEARVEFVAHLRGQARFESAHALSDQMARDITTTRQVLAAGSPRAQTT